MNKKNKFLWIILVLIATVSFVDASAITGAVGGGTTSGTDTYGFSNIFTQLAGIIEDNGLRKIIGIIGGLASLIVLYSGRIAGGTLVIVITMAFAYLPQIVDKVYGAII